MSWFTGTFLPSLRTTGGDEMFLRVSRKAALTDEVISNLLQAHKAMATAEKVDARGLIALTKYLLRLAQKCDDDLIKLTPPGDEDRG